MISKQISKRIPKSEVNFKFSYEENNQEWVRLPNLEKLGPNSKLNIGEILNKVSNLFKILLCFNINFF